VLHKFNTLARLVIVGLLIFPVPVYADSHITTETETFDGENGALVTDLTVPSGSLAVDSDDVSTRNDQNCCGVSGQYFFSLKDNYVGNSQATSYTFTLPDDHDITEIGFRMAGVNYAYTIKYNYSDDTDETINKNAQGNTSYEDLTKAVTGKYIVSFVVTVSDWVGIDTIYWKYDSTPPTTTTTTTLSPLDIERNNNFAETGVLETNDERVEREYQDAQDWERDKNQSETGYWELDSERRDREAREAAEAEAARIAEEERIAAELEAERLRLEEEARLKAEEEARLEAERIQKEKEDAIKAELQANLQSDVELDEEELEEFIEVMQEIEENIEELEELAEQVEEEVIEIKEVDAEEIIVALTPTTTTTTTTTTTLPPPTEAIDELTEEEKEAVQEVVDTIEELDTLTEEEQEVVAEVLGVETEELEIVAELIEEEPAVAQAVEEFVERAAEDDSDDYTLADAVVEVQLEEFIADPIGAIIDIEIEPIELREVIELGNDMTTDQKEKAQEVVVPVILVSQIIATSSIIPIRRIR